MFFGSALYSIRCIFSFKLECLTLKCLSATIKSQLLSIYIIYFMKKHQLFSTNWNLLLQFKQIIFYEANLNILELVWLFSATTFTQVFQNVVLLTTFSACVQNCRSGIPLVRFRVRDHGGGRSASSEAACTPHKARSRASRASRSILVLLKKIIQFCLRL